MIETTESCVITGLVVALGRAVEVVGEGRVEGGLEVGGGEIDEEGHRGRKGRRDWDVDVPRRVYLRQVEPRVQGRQPVLVLLLNDQLVHVEV
jgi:hypothetical protein